MFDCIPKVRNKINCEIPLFYTSGIARNIPYTILIHNHIFDSIYIIFRIINYLYLLGIYL